jgi:type II secretory pathway component PulK
LDQLTTTFEARLVGQINVNTAPLKVLQAVPGISEGKAELIVQHRESLTPEQKQSIAWLYADNVLTADEFKQAAPYITARSLQFRLNVLGYSLPSGRYRACEVLIDTADKAPQIIYLRDLTKLGLPFALPAPDETTDVQTPKQI